MNRRKPAYLAIIFLVVFNSHPQDICGQANLPQGLLKPLTIGDTVPDVVLENIINYPSSSARLSHFKGKLLILDFWATWCGSCIKYFPRLDSLEQASNGQLQILLVNVKKTGDTKSKILAFLERRRKLKQEINHPIVAEDCVLNEYFPNRMIPHYVWIDSRGIVTAITGPEELTGQNFKQFLAGIPLNLPVKRDRIEYTNERMLLESDNGGEMDKLLFSSRLTSFLPGMPSQSSAFSSPAPGVIKRTYINHPILNLYKEALFFESYNLVLQVKDPSLFGLTDTSGGLQPNVYSYEIMLPEVRKAEMAAYMVQDLNRFFRLSLRKDTLLMPCLVLESMDAGARVKTSGGEKFIHWPTDTEPFTELRNVSVAELVKRWNRHPLQLPLPVQVLDETGLKDKIDVKLFHSPANREKLNQELSHYGLRLTEAFRKKQVYVIADNIN